MTDKEPDDREAMEHSNKRVHEQSSDEANRARNRIGPRNLDWNEPQIATDRSLQPMIRGYDDRNQEESLGLPEAQERAMQRELLTLRERQHLLLNRSLMFGGDMPATNVMDPSLARYRQLELLSGGGGTNPDLLPLQQRLGLLRGDTSLGEDLQDSSRSSHSGQDVDSLRLQLERRSQLEALMAQRQEELLFRRLEQERDASLERLRRQEALLTAIREGQPLPDFDSAALFRGGSSGNFLQPNTHLLGQNDLLARRQAELSSLFGSRGMQTNTTSLDHLSRSLLESHRSTQRDNEPSDSNFSRKETFDQEKSKSDHKEVGESGNAM